MKDAQDRGVRDYIGHRIGMGVGTAQKSADLHVSDTRPAQLPEWRHVSTQVVVS